MRIIGGNFKGKKIITPIDKSTRPLKDMVRESIFNILEHSKNEFVNLNGSKILDLFSGTGSFGIECISRGAEKVIFFENYINSIKILKKNLDLLELNKHVKIVEKDVYDINQLHLNLKKFDLIFLDPPFKDNKINKIIETIKRMKRIVKMGVVLSIAAIAFTAYSASASALQPSFDEDMIIDVDDVLFPEELIPLFGTDVDIEASGCLPHWMGPEGINITVTNNSDLAKGYDVFVYNGVVEIEETPEFTFPEEATGSDSEFIFPGESHEFPRYIGPLFAPESPTVVRVQITESLPVLLIDAEDDVIVEADVIFDEEIIVCEYDADEMLSEAAEEFAAAEALVR